MGMFIANERNILIKFAEFLGIEKQRVDDYLNISKWEASDDRG